MSLPGGGIFVVKGEMSTLTTAMRRGARWSAHSYQDDEVDNLTRSFQELKDALNKVNDLTEIEPTSYLTPFLNVIKSDETTGPVTSLALSSINKFLSYGLISKLADTHHAALAVIVHNVADAVTHARFVGTDQNSDGVVLMRILQVLRTLSLSPEGALLTNESLCEIMLSCFRICFENRLNELLRKTAEHYLKDMVHMVFTRLPQFSEDAQSFTGKQFKMRPGAVEQTRSKRKKLSKTKKTTNQEKNDDELRTPNSSNNLKVPNSKTGRLSTTPSTPSDNILDMQGTISQSSPSDEATAEPYQSQLDEESSQDYVNQRGIRFTAQEDDDAATLSPYGLACVKELFRFLISLCNPLDKQNTDVMLHLGLTLLTVAFEVGAESIGNYPSLLHLMKDDLCRNLISLLNSERVSVFAADLQVSFLMFQSLRAHLKFQLELYLTKLIEIIATDSLKVTYEHKEIALDNVLQLWRIPGLVAELYLNYDCDMYCTNLYEDLTKLLAKNAYSATSGVYHTHIMSLDALLLIIETIDRNSCLDAEDDRSDSIPPKEVLLERKNKKKWLPVGTEHFNHKPKKGIQFFQEHGILGTEWNPHEIATFLKDNPGLDKKMIGEFISNRSNLDILEAFVKTFDFRDMRIDEALRLYLETFRLPGEAPTISLLLEQFAEHWHKSNGEPFADVDSAFTLAYAVIMLNVDQHNENAKKQTVPMTQSGFKKNVAGVNGGGDFDEEMLDEIYNTIKNDEIVMPAEQSGAVRDNYLWKVLIRKGASKDGVYYRARRPAHDRELFALIWAPALSALSFVYDRSEEPNVYKRALRGFETCARVSAHFNLTANMDLLVSTLCKFTPQNGIAPFANNQKARLAFRALFELAHRHGDYLRDGWRNIFDVVLSLYTYGLCPKSYVEVEDFIETSGRIALVYKEAENSQKQDAGLFSSLYSYMVSSENLNSRSPTVEERELTEMARKCVNDCNLEQLVVDSKFLHEDALLHLIGTLVDLSRGPDVHKSLGYNYNENVTVFFLEMLIRIMIQNRDRVLSIWQIVRDHIYTLVMNSSLFDYQFLLERSVIGLLRVAIRLMRNEDMSPVVLQSLRMLLLLKSATLCRISRQISFGLYELLKTSAQNIHTKADWTIVFALLECVGAGAQPPKPIAGDDAHLSGDQAPDHGTKSDDGDRRPSGDDDYSFLDRGYTSDSELTSGRSTRNAAARPNSPPSSSVANSSGGWILVSKGAATDDEVGVVVGRAMPPAQYNLALEKNLGSHDPSSLIKCCESLAFLVRDVAHITPYNFDACIHCIRTFVEASLHGNYNGKGKGGARGKRRTMRRANDVYKSRRSPASSPDEESEDEDEVPSGYHQISIQLLDLMHTLHTRTAQIFNWWSQEGGEVPDDMSLWTHGWCPLLQGIARLCCDLRKEVRMAAITYLQRALLVPDLQSLSGPEWEACFHRVLFPLLSYLLQPINPKEPLAAMEETRMRAATLLSKVFLHHLTPLLSLPTFDNLWLIILDFMDKYMHADKSDLLFEAIPESLKNMLLVMDSAKVFENEGAEGTKNRLWHATWARIDQFLPDMKEGLFKEPKPELQEVEDKLVPHNIENATRSSIILQPPPLQKSNVSSHLFAHLGQMVSTPIVSPTEIQAPQISMQPTLQPGMPYMPNLFVQQQQQTFPVLYNQKTVVPTTSPPTEVQPVSLYTEYLTNPYNTREGAAEPAAGAAENNNVDDAESAPANNNGLSNYFPPSNYFLGQSGHSPQPGSEMFYGAQTVYAGSGSKISDI